MYLLDDCHLPASCLHWAPSASIVKQFQKHYHSYQFTSRRLSICCCRTTPLQQSSYSCPSTWSVLGHLPPQIKNVFNCSRHQRLVTLAFRCCVQIFFLTYLSLCAVQAEAEHEVNPRFLQSVQILLCGNSLKHECTATLCTVKSHTQHWNFMLVSFNFNMQLIQQVAKVMWQRPHWICGRTLTLP